ncbi:hypothetical protein Tco_1037527 [Tanacetum coccineum]
MMSVHISSGLVLCYITSDHNRSELRIQDHSNEQTSSKLVPKVVPLAVKTATSRQELESLFHHHIAMLRTTDIANDIHDPVMQCTTLLIHSGFSQQKLVSFVMEIHKLSIDISLRDLSSNETALAVGDVQILYEIKLVTTDIDMVHMSMLVKDIRSQDGKDDKDNDKGSKSRSQSMKEQDYNEDKDQEHSSLNDKSNLTDLMKECHQ